MRIVLSALDKAKMHFSNKNLNKLYLQAYEAGFSDKELQQLAAVSHGKDESVTRRHLRLS